RWLVPQHAGRVAVVRGWRLREEAAIPSARAAPANDTARPTRYRSRAPALLLLDGEAARGEPHGDVLDHAGNRRRRRRGSIPARGRTVLRAPSTIRFTRPTAPVQPRFRASRGRLTLGMSFANR